MADDIYNTLLQFTTDASQTNKDIKDTTANLAKMEEQAAKVSKIEFRPVPEGYVSEFEKTMHRLVAEAKAAGIKVREGLVKEGLSQGMFSDARGELNKVINQLEIIKKERAKAVQAAIIPPSATSEQLSAIDPEIVKRARELEAEGEKIGTVFSKSFDQLIAHSYTAGQAIKRLENEIKQTNKVAEANSASEQRRDQETRRAASVRAALYNREAQILRKMSSDIREQAGILRNQAQQIQGISQLALGIGGGVVGGVFAFASKYVRDAKEATETTVAWKAAQESLAKSGQQVGAVLAREALPLLRIAAQTAEKAAAFVEKHPELVRAAINVGLVTASLGAVGLAVSKGIKLYADQLYLSSIPLQLEAGRLQFAAAQEQLIAAKLRAGVSTGTAGAGGGGAAGAAAGAPIAGFIGLIAASAVASKQASDVLGQLQVKLLEVSKSTPLVHALMEGIKNGLAPILPFIGSFDILKRTLPQLEELGKKIGLIGDQAETSSEKLSGVRGSSAFEQILSAYEDYRRDDLALVQKHYAERQAIVSQSLKAEAAANARYTADRVRISVQLGRAIASATEQYEQESIRAEQEFAQQRAQTIRDSGIEIQRIEEDLQENLRKLRQDHEGRLEELVASRDALGIVKEQQRYNQERAEQVRQTNLEIRQRRADLAIRLTDQAQAFAQERAQRFADFQARIDEMRAQAAEQMKELAARHQEEIAQIRTQRIERIKELDSQLQDERKRRHEYFLDQIRNLDAALLGEAELRKRRQDEMVAELDAFLLRYKSGMAQLHTVPAGRAKGGYATYGTYVLGDSTAGGRGKPEYVLGGDVTQLAERVLGGQITQSKMTALLNAMNGGSRNNVVYNDERRIDSRISQVDREQMVDDTLSAFGKIFG